MKICSVCQRCYEDAAENCVENHGSLAAARSGTRQITADYRLDTLLGQDAAGETYQASRRDSDEIFVVRIISANAVGGAEQRRKLEDETRAAANLQHLNVARVYESGSIGDGEFYIVTEAVSGQTLDECLRKVGAFPEAEAVLIAGHAAAALEAAHSFGVVHRAVSPANIILAQNGEKLAVKLRNFDFGGIGQQTIVGSSNPPIEKLRYLSPEQTAGQTADARSDVYSLAVVLYEMLCGRSPFGAPTPAAIAERRINEQPLDKLGFDTRALLKHVLTASLQKRPEARPQTAGSFARQLRHVGQLLGLAPPPPRDAAPSSTVIQSAAVAAAVAAPFESPGKLEPRELTTQQFAGEIPPATAPAASLPIEKTEAEAEANRFSESIHVSEKEFGGESFAAHPIPLRKKESNGAPSESIAAPFAADAISVKKTFEAAPIAVRKKPFDAVVSAAAPEFTPAAAPVFIERKNAEVSAAPEAFDLPAAAPVINSPAARQVINLPAADVWATRKVPSETLSDTPSNRAIFADSVNVDQTRRVPRAAPGQPLLIGAALLALLVSGLFAAFLYNRRHQPSAVQPEIAQQTPAPTAPPTVAETSDEATNSDAADSAAARDIPASPATEAAPASSAAGKPAQTAPKRENQLREAASSTVRTPPPNESPKNPAAREIPAASSAVVADAGGDTRPRSAAANADAQTELNSSLADWVSATNDRSVDRQMNYYAPKMNSYYRAKNVSPDAVRREKNRVFAAADTVDIQTGKPEIAVSPDGKTATMRFRKKYAIKQGQQNRRGEVLQELRWVKSGSAWRIVSERDVKVINR